MTNKAWIIFAALSVLLLGGLVYLSGQNSIDVETVKENAIQAPTAQSGNIGDHVYGNKDAKVTLIEYGDFQCPGCASAHPTVQEVKETYKDDIAFVFRNFPLTSIHPNARVAAASAEAAAKQDKYWEMHDTLYTAQKEWETASIDDRGGIFEQYAKQIGLNIAQYKEDIISQSVTEKINFDLALGKKHNVTSTPTFILNGRQLPQEEWSSVEALSKAIESEIAKQK